MVTAEDVRREFDRTGLSISAWAEARGFSKALVYRVLAGKRKARRGQSHRIAVALGLKEGIPAEISDLSFEQGNTQATNGCNGVEVRHHDPRTGDLPIAAKSG